MDSGNSLQVQWIESVCSLPRAQVQSLVRELRSHEPRVQTKKKKKIVCLWRVLGSESQHENKRVRGVGQQERGWWKLGQSCWTWTGVGVGGTPCPDGQCYGGS